MKQEPEIVIFFVDETADFDMAMDIILNAKTQRIGVCNACESLVIHEKIADTFLPELMKRLAEKNVEVHGDEKVMQIAGEGCMKRELLVPATKEDWGREYLDYKLSVKTVSSIDEAYCPYQSIQHIPFRGNHHKQLFQCGEVLKRD